jgi:hypothetical protein
MPENVQRRALVFNYLDDVIADAENLRAKGYIKAGNWDLAQVCGHIAAWVRFATDGYPRPGCFLGVVLWMMRSTVGKRMLRAAIRDNKMKSGVPTFKETVPAPGGDEAAAVADLKEAIDRFGKHVGEYHPSTLFGRWTREECLKLNLMHAAHHLNYLIPNS